jgi:hypothetical protein
VEATGLLELVLFVEGPNGFVDDAGFTGKLLASKGIAEAGLLRGDVGAIAL